MATATKQRFGSGRYVMLVKPLSQKASSCEVCNPLKVIVVLVYSTTLQTVGM